MLCRINLMPNDLVGKVFIKKVQMRGEDVAKGRRCIDLQRSALAVESEGREQRKESEYMVTVKVRDEYCPEFQWIDSKAEHLALSPLAGINQE